VNRPLVCWLVLMIGIAAAADTLGPPVDLIQGLATHQIYAQFWGGGDLGVNGIIGRGQNGPAGVTVSPGTQFWAQLPGRQGQTGLGRTSLDLSTRRYAQVWIPTACTNINLQAPTETDVMLAAACPNQDMERLSSYLADNAAPRPSVQVAVWAVANDPPPMYPALSQYILAQAQLSEGKLTPLGIMTSAAGLMQAAGLMPTAYRLVREARCRRCMTNR
jgi:hypothetical protein